MRDMKDASILVPLVIGAALSIAALPASAQANRESVSRVEAELYGEDHLQREEGARPQPASAEHELTHTVQQREVAAVESAAGSQRGVRHQQGRVITDADHNTSRAPGQPSSPGGVNDGTSKTVLVNEAPGTPAPASEDARSSANPFMPEVDDEVLAAMENGNYSFSGDYLVVSVRHRAPVRLRPGRYRTAGGRTFSIGNGRIVVHGTGDLRRPVIIGTVPNPPSAPPQPAASQPQQTDYGFVRAPASPASDSAAGADKVTVRGWDAQSKKETANDDIRHPGTERVTDGEQ